MLRSCPVCGYVTLRLTGCPACEGQESKRRREGTKPGRKRKKHAAQMREWRARKALEEAAALRAGKPVKVKMARKP